MCSGTDRRTVKMLHDRLENQERKVNSKHLLEDTRPVMIGVQVGRGRC